MQESYYEENDSLRAISITFNLLNKGLIKGFQKIPGKWMTFSRMVASYVLVLPKRWPTHATAFVGILLMLPHSRN
jgi:hypothetical protein